MRTKNASVCTVLGLQENKKTQQKHRKNPQNKTQNPPPTAVGTYLDLSFHLHVLQVPSVFKTELYRRQKEVAEGMDGGFL